MKAFRKILPVILALVAMSMQSCNKDEIVEPSIDTGILPQKFKVDIPSSISNDEVSTKAAYKSAGNEFSGDSVYAHLRNFVALGEGAAEVVQELMYAISKYNLSGAQSLSFISDDDGKTKNLLVVENGMYDNRNWEYMLTLTDAESENASDSGMAMQVFWNKNPVEGVAVMKPSNIDKKKASVSGQAKYLIEYSEVGTADYDSYMLVKIADLPEVEDNVGLFAVDNIMMFVGKAGNRIDVFGNSNHPKAKFFTEQVGYNWAFVASGFENDNIGVAEVGLPSSNLDTDSRKVLLEDNSMKAILTREVQKHFQDEGWEVDSATISPWLGDADAPGFFDENGFVQAGDAPSDSYLPLENSILKLAPYNPNVIGNISISFK